ncbi:hypothetical protein Cob_v004755 [Colletotrichum orbiculare MAFF 240422]|uniref:Uncharacterized protein n=1 Tax=Colletotrichum orbiculare (strain 104-T / ATCC 96160 / CBS 514.97 / LARS 414 / MAFF 240422) TaxID=1213857 RepID=A0A484FY08_COLOR|nr:hypothetical protein Cob_v004755 [Colletotrichum orbiculare MAFF 240422]
MACNQASAHFGEETLDGNDRNKALISRQKGVERRHRHFALPLLLRTMLLRHHLPSSGVTALGGGRGGRVAERQHSQLHDPSAPRDGHDGNVTR